MTTDRFLSKLAVHFHERNDQLSLDCMRFVLTRIITQVEELAAGLSSLTPKQKQELFTLTDESGALQDLPDKVVLYGAGVVGYFALSIIESMGNSKVVAFVDTIKTGSYYGKQIITIEQYKQDYSDIKLIVAIDQPEKLSAFLKNVGICNNYYFKLITNFWITLHYREAARLKELSGEPQYFSLKELPHSKDEVFVECGVMDGGTIKDFITWAGGDYKKIFGFEPDPHWYQTSKTNLQIHRDVTLIEAAVCDRIGKGMLEFKILTCASLNDSEGTHEVRLATIDNELAGEKVTFLKMDIEGAELEALKGAQTIIREQKPKLAICVYHKYTDLWEIPAYIWSLNPAYKFYLRHYLDSWGETVLYAIP